MERYEIDEIKRVSLNGLRQKIHILGRWAAAPVLLFLHGGPGITNRHSIIHNHRELAEHFIIVAWDQRGTGGSYFGAKPAAMTVGTFLKDLHELALYLVSTLDKQKIYIIGGSWGTELGILMAREHPELVEAYIGYGQVVNGFLNEQLAFDFVFEKAMEAGDRKALRTLSLIGPPQNGCYKPVYKGLLKHRALLSRYGGSSVKKTSLWEGTVKPILLSREYTLKDKAGILLGHKYTLSVMWEDVVRYDYIKEAAKLRVPVFIFQGRLDRNTPSSLVAQYYEVLEAPHKELVWFENSAHNPLNDEKERFHKLLIEKLLSGKVPGRV